MGLLDDAIREHLELKRLRGADPSEVARAEREALGPVRRAVDPTAEPGPEGPQALTPEPDDPPEAIDDGDFDAAPHGESFEHVSTIPATEDHDAFPERPGAGAYARHDEVEDWSEPRLDEEEPFASPGRAVAPEEYDEHATQVYHAPNAEPDPLPADPPAPVRPLPSDGDAAVEGDPAAYDEMELDEDPRPARPPAPPADSGQAPPAPDEHAGDEDVLEETPDFLQETPEHDRLWFEQRPPRDFDFDK